MLSGLFLVQNIMSHENGPMAHSFACKNQDFDGPFDILMGHLKKKDGPKKP